MTSEKIKPCQFCQNTDTREIKDGNLYYVYCDNCNAHGPTSSSLYDAVYFWNYVADIVNGMGN